MSALDRQVGGAHYKSFAIQPIVFCEKNGLSPIASNIIKYACRYKTIKRHGSDRPNVEDLRKIVHYAEIAIQRELEAELASEEEQFRTDHQFKPFSEERDVVLSEEVEDPKLSAHLAKATCEDGTCDL